MKAMRLSAPGAVSCILLILAGCGGGGGGDPAPTDGTSPTSTLSGTAAAGAPIIGTVTVKDSAAPPQTKVGAIDADGKYNIDVAGMTAPFMLRAEGTVGGRSYSLFSAGTAADVNATINITPLTDLIVANIAAQLAEAAYDNGNFSGMTTEALNAAQSALRARLQPVLSAVGLSDSIDLLRTSFNTDNTGLDGALDVIRVTADPATLTATITNIIDNQQIVDDLASQADTTVLNQTNVASGLTDLQQIVASFDQFTALFATSVPASDNATLRGLFVETGFLDDGQNLDAFLGEITSDPGLIGIQFTNIALNSLTATTADVAFAVQFLGQTHFLTMQASKASGAWKLAGNQRIARANVFAFARHHVNASSDVPQFDTGLVFEIEDPASVVDYAIVTGPGLPDAGALYVRLTSQGSFKAAQGTTYMGIDSATPSLNNFGHNQFPLSSDTTIAGIPDNAVYTIVLKDDNNTPSDMSDDTTPATYTATLPRRPFLNSELGTSLFAAISSPTAAQILNVAQNGGTLSVSWTLPTGGNAAGLHFFRSGDMPSLFDTVDVDLAASDTSANMVVTAPTGSVESSGLNLFINDVFARERITILQGQ